MIFNKAYNTRGVSIKQYIRLIDQSTKYLALTLTSALLNIDILFRGFNIDYLTSSYY